MSGETTPEAGQDNTATARGTEANGRTPAPNAATTATAAPATPAERPASEAWQNAGNDAARDANAATERSNPPAGREGGGEGGPPTAFEPRLPEGTVVDNEAMAAVKEYVDSGALAPETAQKLLDQHLAAIDRYEEHRAAAAIKQVDAWEAEIRNSREFGGPRLDENIEAAKLMLQKYGSPRLTDEFRRMGVLSHPEFAFMLMRMHRDVSEGRSLAGTTQATPETSAAAAIYPTMATRR